MARELLNDGAGIEIALNLGKVSIRLPDHETSLVLRISVKCVNIVNSVVSSKSDLLFFFLSKEVSINVFSVSYNLFNLNRKSFVEEDSLLSFNRENRDLSFK